MSNQSPSNMNEEPSSGSKFTSKQQENNNTGQTVGSANNSTVMSDTMRATAAKGASVETSEIVYTTRLDGMDWAALKATLQADAFHDGRSPEQYERSFRQSHLVCLALAYQQIIGTARVLSDGVCSAYIVDVWTHSAYRHRGIGSAIMRLLLEQLPGQHVYLFTDDAMRFYEQLGFRPQPTGMSLVVGRWLDSGT